MDYSRSTSRSVSSIRWLGRISGGLLVVFLAVFMIGQGGPPNVFAQPVPVQLEFLGMVMIVFGAILGWWRDIVGGILSLAGFVLFCAVELVVNGAMPGGAIPLFCVPGALLILAGLFSPP